MARWRGWPWLSDPDDKERNVRSFKFGWGSSKWIKWLRTDSSAWFKKNFFPLIDFSVFQLKVSKKKLLELFQQLIATITAVNSMPEHFVYLTFCLLAILSACHFIYLPSNRVTISSSRHFFNLPFYQLAISLTCHFVNLPFL